MQAHEDDQIIQHLKNELTALDQRRAALCSAVAALEGTAPPQAPRAGRIAVGEDKIDAVRKYIRSKGRVRQAEITKALGFNSGTVSTATHALLLAGEIEKGPKEDRSITWKYAS